MVQSINILRLAKAMVISGIGMPTLRRLWLALRRRFQHRKQAEPGKGGDTFEKFMREFREHSAGTEEQQRPRKRAS